MGFWLRPLSLPAWPFIDSTVVNVALARTAKAILVRALSPYSGWWKPTVLALAALILVGGSMGGSRRSAQNFSSGRDIVLLLRPSPAASHQPSGY